MGSGGAAGHKVSVFIFVVNAGGNVRARGKGRSCNKRFRKLCSFI